MSTLFNYLFNNSLSTSKLSNKKYGNYNNTNKSILKTYDNNEISKLYYNKYMFYTITIYKNNEPIIMYTLKNVDYYDNIHLYINDKVYNIFYIDNSITYLQIKSDKKCISFTDDNNITITLLNKNSKKTIIKTAPRDDTIETDDTHIILMKT